MSQLLFYGITLAVGIFIGNVLLKNRIIGSENIDKTPLLDIIRFMETNKYQSGMSKPTITVTDLVSFIPKPPFTPPPCDLTICIDVAYLDNIIFPDEGDFTLKISDNKKIIIKEEIKGFKKGTSHRIFSLKSKVPLNQKVSLELSVVYKDGSSKEIILDEVVFVK